MIPNWLGGHNEGERKEPLHPLSLSTGVWVARDVCNWWLTHPILIATSSSLASVRTTGSFLLPVLDFLFFIDCWLIFGHLRPQPPSLVLIWQTCCLCSCSTRLQVAQNAAQPPSNPFVLYTTICLHDNQGRTGKESMWGCWGWWAVEW